MSMTLLDRVRVMEGKSAPTSAAELTVADLRRAVWRHIPMEAVARMSLDDPDRARSEIRMASKRAFLDPKWADVDLEKRQHLVDQLIDTVFGMGPLEPYLTDESVTEIMVNGSDGVFIEREGCISACESLVLTDDQVRVLIDRILAPLGRRIDEASPMVSARLPQGHRVHAVIPPIALNGPTLTIRSFAKKTITLELMTKAGSLDQTVAELLTWAVRARKSIAVCGGTGSGKTTLLNALSCKIPHAERIITIEDAAELKFADHPHVVRLEARPRNAEGLGEITIRDLVVNSLRMRPDRIVVGECRGGEALDMLQAMTTGHDGSMTTLHANSPQDAIDRLITMVRYAVDLPVDAIEAQIGNAFDLVVQLSRSKEGARFVSEVVEMSFDRQIRMAKVRRLYLRGSFDESGEWINCPDLISILANRGIAEEEEVRAWCLRACV